MSGSHVDVVVITREKAELIRPLTIASKKGERQGSYKYKQGSTAILSTRVMKFDVEATSVRHVEPMETA